MSSLEIQNITKRFGDKIVLDNISLTVAEGEFFVLLGGSGSGKSTLLKLISGLDDADSGRVLIDGRDVTTLPPRDRNIGMVFQDFGLYPNMTVFENIAFGLQARNVPKAEIAQRVPEAAEKLGIGGDYLEREIYDLSGGEQQRVALARAMVKSADIYLFDEPLSNLDPKLRYKARRDIMKLHKIKRRPSIYVTHDQTEAFMMGDRIGVLVDGMLQQIGDADTLLQQPANLTIARFIGEPPMNLLNPGLDLFPVAQDAIIGFRPDAIALAGSLEAADIDTPHPFNGTVTDIEVLIGETIVTLEIAPDVTVTAVLEDDAAEALALGESVACVVDGGRVCTFDPVSGTRLMS